MTARRSPAPQDRAPFETLASVNRDSTSRPASIPLHPSTETTARSIVDAVGPTEALRIAAAVLVVCDRLRPPRRAPYVGPSCDHPGGPGYVYERTLAEKAKRGGRQ